MNEIETWYISTFPVCCYITWVSNEVLQFMYWSLTTVTLSFFVIVLVLVSDFVNWSFFVIVSSVLVSANFANAARD